MFFWKKRTPVGQPVQPPRDEAPSPPLPPPMTAEQFINKYRRNYVSYPHLIEAAFGLGDEMFDEYDRLSDDDIREVVEYAKMWVQQA